MTFTLPSVAQLRQAAERLGMAPTDDYLEATRRILEPLAGAYRVLDGIPDEVPLVKYPRTPGYRPEGAENLHGAWYVKTAVKGAARGKLKGRRIALKDNVCLAGVPMMAGTSTLEGYVPDLDATVATRILDAGGEIAGKAVCEYYCVSGGSHTSSTGPVINPRVPGHSAGGSSSGSAALVAAGEVDMAIGGDQAGSIRIPASYCGVVGLKPTYGLVPYSGIIPLEVTVDHCGPIAASVADNALLLEVIAGADGLDGRQKTPKVRPYTKALTGDADGLRIAVVHEGFGHAHSEPDVDATVRREAKRLKKLGAKVKEVSIPWHRMALPIWTPIVHDGGLITMLTMNGAGVCHEGLYVTSLVDASAGWRDRTDEFADTIRIMALIGQHSLDHHRGHYYAKAQNLRRRLRAAYNAVFAEHDLLLMPTQPLKATPLPPPDAPPELVTQRSWENIDNTCAFNVTGHPAITVPCGTGDGRPIGLMLVGRHHEETTLYRAAHAYEQAGDWQRR
ncbi:MAG TPA: amidase [Alphaproteobacteria bacterium]|jgi:amidase|nr:amidase [Alphaproteobacteria bacterium]HJM50166.1 amidase [Alphaproteobacteria bacterium]